MSRGALGLLSACWLLFTSAFPARADEPAGAAPATGAELCAIDPARVAANIRANYVPQAWAMRNELFLRACRESYGLFIDYTDPTLGKRVVRPDGMSADNTDDHYPPEAKRAHQSGWIDLVYVVEADGTVSNVTPVQGAEVFLKAAVDVMKTAKYRKPAYLDGKPIRSLGYARLVFQ